MVTGIDSFKEWFKGSEEQYAIIGGTACDILMTEEGLDFRATKDIKAKETALSMAEEGMDVKMIARLVKVSEKDVQKWIDETLCVTK